MVRARRGAAMVIKWFLLHASSKVTTERMRRVVYFVTSC